MKRLALALTVMSFFTLGMYAQVTQHQTRETSNVQYTTFVPCANNGAGENVDLAGVFNTMIISNVTGTGPGWSAQGFIQTRQKVVGVGEATGSPYHGSGVFNLTFKLYPPAGQVSTEQQNLTVIGGGETLQLHFNLNFAISTDGNLLTFSVDNFQAHCN